MLKIYITLILLIVGAVSQFQPTNTTITIPQGTIQLDYSPDHKFLGILAPTQLLVLATQTNKQVDLITFAGFTGSSFAFNSDGTYLAVGSLDGETHLYAYNGSNFLPSEKVLKDVTTKTVESVCFTSDGKYVVLADVDKVFVWSWNEDINMTENFNGSFAQSVSCSPTNATLFAVGGGLNTQSHLVFYNIGATSIDIVKTVNKQPSKQITSLCWNGDGTKLYRVQVDDKIYKCDSDGENQAELGITELAGAELQKIRVSNNERLVAVVSSTKIYIITQTASGSLMRVGAAPEIFDTPIPSVALSGKGDYMFYVNPTGSGDGLSQCTAKQYTDDTGACVDCDPSCPTCDGSSTNCFSCVAKYYLEGNTCKKCSTGCLGCQSGTTCDQCDIHFHTDAGACVCDDAYFPSGQSCLACSTGCTTCTDENTCTACKPEFDLKNNACQCKPSTYPSADTCLPCIRGCTDCADGTTCTTCNAQQRYIKDPNNLCICDAALNVRDDGAKCVCIDGYYENAGVCAQCPVGCKTCDSGTTCTTCEGDLEIKDGLCKCPNDGQWVDTDFSCKVCADTLPFCLACDRGDFCDTCDAVVHRVSKAGKCQCQNGYFNDTQGDCTLCAITGCQECSAADVCTVCKAAQHWQNDATTQKCKCMKHYFEDNTTLTCQACSTGCNTCSSATLCSQCDTVNNWVEKAGACECKPAYYQNDQVCDKCIVGCSVCADGATCQTCNQADHWKKNGANKCVCVDNTYYQKAGQCISCKTLHKCITCVSDAICSSCSDPFILLDGKCKCQKGKYQNEQACTDCPEGCQQCNNADQCTVCKDGYDLEQLKCKKNGIDTLVIVLVVVGVIVLAGAVFVVIKCIKKRKSPLSQDDYEEL